MFASPHNPVLTPELIYWEQNVNAAGIIDFAVPVDINPGDKLFYVIQTALNVSKASSVTCTDQGGNTNVPLLFYDGPPLGLAGTNANAFHGVLLLNYPTGMVASSTVRFNLNGAAFWGVPTWLNVYRLRGVGRIQIYYRQPNGVYLTTTPLTIPFARTSSGAAYTSLVAHRSPAVLTCSMLVSGNNNMSVTSTTGFTAFQTNTFSAGASLSASVSWKFNATADEQTASQNQVIINSAVNNTLADIALLRFIP